MNYRHTHVSVNDGSPAMLVENRGMRLLLTNEDGYEWEDHAYNWEPIEQPIVSGQKPLMVISLLRHRKTGNWYAANLGWVTDQSLASLVSDEVHELVLKAVPFPDELELVRFVELPL